MARIYQDVSFSIDRQSAVLDTGLSNIANAILVPRYTETHTNGKSWGGAQTVTNEEYEEHALTEQNGFTTGENWSTAWAIDTSHAANLVFTYTVQNVGTDYARELSGLIINVYLNDELINSYPAWQQFANGKLENLFPGSAPIMLHSNPIALTLDQMRQMDEGARMRITVETFSYGADELFYQGATSGGITFYVEDGVEDDDESVDMYVIPTWSAESVQDVLTRYFPASYDSDGRLNSLWTPEYNGTTPPVFHEHFLSDVEWWNLYLTQSEGGNSELRDLPAQAGSSLLIRMNRDSDRDGYQDRVELRYGTDKNDPTSHPNPEILAGYAVTRTGNLVTATVALENSGSFDAYGIQVTMYSPDATTTVIDNIVGGNGRVRPGRHVAVGAMLKAPSLIGWNGSTAQPYVIGDYSGNDKTFTFTVSAQGTVGQGSTSLTWNDGKGASGILDVGASYHAPLALAVRDGLELGLNTGSLAAGTYFTVTALSPRDTLRYVINTDPNNPSSYMEPVIVVSYNDPQGNTKFVTPIKLNKLSQNLAPYSGQMLTPLEFGIRTNHSVTTTGVNTTTFLFNSPHTAVINDAHLYLDFVSDGVRVLTISRTLDILPGPNLTDVSWSTSQFTQTYDANKDNILIAHWTDSENNIIDSAARPLNLFMPEASPQFMISSADTTWDFGTAAQGTLLKKSFTLANTGQLDLLTYVGAPQGVSLSQTGSRRIGPADMTTYEIALNTSLMSLGAYSQTITLRSSDPNRPTRTVQLAGTVIAGAPDTTGGSFRPLDVDVTVTGNQNQGTWWTYSHSLGPDPVSLHPVKVYNDTYTHMWGVGKYATDFAAGTAPADMFGDGRDGPLTVSSDMLFTPIDSSCSGTSGSTVLVATNSLFASDQIIMIHQSQGPGAGNWEINSIARYASGQITTKKPLSYVYGVGAQVLVLRQYSNVTINPNVNLNTKAWNGSVGGILAFISNGTVNLSGKINNSPYAAKRTGCN